MKPGQTFLVFLAYTCDAVRQPPIEIQSLGPEHEPFLPQKPRAAETAETAAAGTPGNLMETGQLDGECSKEDEVWTLTGKELGKGRNVSVVEVKGKHHKGRYALKEALDDHGVEDVKNEMAVMSAAMRHSCPAVMRLTEEAPCIKDGKWFGKSSKKAAAYVSPEMQGDLFSWMKHNIRRFYCSSRMVQQVAQGMHCLHSAGYIHGDLKSDNMFYKELDEEGCPSGIVLAGFRLSKKVNEIVGTYDGQYFSGSDHLPDSLFDGHEDSLHIRVPGTTASYYADPKIDYCSLSAWAYFNFKIPGNIENSGTVWNIENTGIPYHGCGPMGEQRRWFFPMRPDE